MVAQGYLGEAFDLGGWYKLTTPVTYDGLLPKRIATGLASRSVDRTTPDVLPLLTAGVGGTQIVEIYWRDIQPNDTNNWNVTKVAEITADIQQARDRGLNVVLRPFAGYYAPDWARALSGGSASGGGMYWYTNDGNLATGAPAPSNSSWKRMPRPMPCWWALDILQRMLASFRRSRKKQHGWAIRSFAAFTWAARLPSMWSRWLSSLLCLKTARLLSRLATPCSRPSRFHLWLRCVPYIFESAKDSYLLRVQLLPTGRNKWRSPNGSLGDPRPDGADGRYSRSHGCDL